MYYDEDVFVGYRYFEAKNLKPLFPFGFGLSYTQFEISNLKVQIDKTESTPELIIRVDVKNVGTRTGKEVIQAYLQPPGAAVPRPKKELKGFQKILLEPGETKTVTLRVKQSDCGYYDSSLKQWVVEKGTHTLLVGNSSDNICCSTEFTWL